MKILTNHMGYSADGPKKVVIRCADGEAPGACRLVDAADRALPFAGPREGIVDAHGGWYDATGDYGIHYAMALKFE